MDNWFAVHSLEAFQQNPRMLGFVAKTKLDGSVLKDQNDKPMPAMDKVLEVKPRDHIVYYCRGDYVIKGIYEVVRACFAEETKWPDSPFQFKIKPIIELDEPFDFRVLLSSLDIFRDLEDIRKWGMSLRGTYNALKRLTDHDYATIEKAIVQARGQGTVREDDEIEGKLGNYRQHLQIQYKIAEWGIENGYRVHIAINDKGKIKEKLNKILSDIPRFHSDKILEIAGRIDALFFDKERDILTHAFEVEHTPTMYSGLLRLNDIAETCHRGTTKFYIISDKGNRDKFDHELERPSFQLLREDKCEFVSYEELGEAWKQLQNKSVPLF